MKVVIIDDEPLISDKLKRIMETGLRGMHTVCAFTDAQMALDYIEHLLAMTSRGRLPF